MISRSSRLKRPLANAIIGVHSRQIGKKFSKSQGPTNSWGQSKRSLASTTPVIEIREDHLIPCATHSYLEDLRKKRFPERNLCFVCKQELGGMLDVTTHAFYYPGGLTELQELRRSTENTMVKSPYVQSQHSSVYVEAPLVRDQSEFVTGLGSMVGNEDPIENSHDCILELRKYNLKLGYDTVPKFMDLYGSGLPSKLHAPGTDPKTSLVSLLYSEVGRLNEVIEVWKHGNGVPGMEQSRVAARQAHEWRDAIASIAELAIEFRSTIHRPL